MCGIAGIVNGGSEDTLRMMADVQAHRGPDDWGVQWFPDHRAGLAHRRLSILDLSPGGHQPMRNKAGQRWITYNGEIYNYLELRHELAGRGQVFTTECDTEVILAAFDEWGKDCVNRFNGMFAFAIYDTESRHLFIARDHLGIKPLYYACIGDTLVFASEAKALFRYERLSPEIEPDALVSTALRLWVPEPITGFRNVFKLPAGHFATFVDGRLRISEYWDVPTGETDVDSAVSETEYVDQLRHLLEQAVRRQLIADVPVGALLSGGLDSSLIVALMHKLDDSRTINTYTIGFSERDKKMEAMPDDAGYANSLAIKLGTQHHEIELGEDINRLMPRMLWHLDDPIGDGAAINTFLIASHAYASGVPVLLSGMGADEIFGGYRRHYAVLMGARYQRLPRIARTSISAIVNALPVAIGGKGIRLTRWARTFVNSNQGTPLDSFIKGFARFGPEQVHEVLQDNLVNKPYDELYPIRRYYEYAEKVQDRPIIEQMTYLDTKLFLPGLNLCYSDKATMAASVESRPPLIDVDIVEFAARLPGRYKIRGSERKYLLKKAAEAYLPKEIIYRPKAPFGTPIRSWVTSGLGDDIRQRFSNRQASHRKYLKQDYPIKLLAEHKAGKADHAHRLWGELVLAQWIDNGPGGASPPETAPAHADPRDAAPGD